MELSPAKTGSTLRDALNAPPFVEFRVPAMAQKRDSVTPLELSNCCDVLRDFIEQRQSGHQLTGSHNHDSVDADVLIAL